VPFWRNFPTHTTSKYGYGRQASKAFFQNAEKTPLHSECVLQSQFATQDNRKHKHENGKEAFFFFFQHTLHSERLLRNTIRNTHLLQNTDP
jgi:hypothetical protein